MQYFSLFLFIQNGWIFKYLTSKIIRTFIKDYICRNLLTMSFLYHLATLSLPSSPSECCFSKARILQGSQQDDHVRHSYQFLGDDNSCIHSKKHSAPENPPDLQSPKPPPEIHQQQFLLKLHNFLPHAPPRTQRSLR